MSVVSNHWITWPQLMSSIPAANRYPAQEKRKNLKHQLYAGECITLINYNTTQ
jgi:hypothetical protein